jgi:PIN domain nuclease of toxin-antitoxin system
MVRYKDEIRDRRIGFALDASAVLALLKREPGSQWVADVLDVSILSAVNWSEVLGKAWGRGADLRNAAGEFAALGLPIIAFGKDDAAAVATLLPLTRPKGLSFGDRACLALAQRYNATALTADRAWAQLDLDGIEVQLIR